MDDRPKSVFSEASRQKKYITTIGIYYCTFTLGICMSFLNPTMLDFSHKFDSSVDYVSKVFTVNFACYLFGALGGGVLMKVLNRQFFVMIALTLMTVPLFTIPFATTPMIFFVLAGVMGFGSGGYDAAQVAWIIDIWRHEAAPFILTQHFAFSLGTLIPALIQGPYLTEEVDEEGCPTSTEDYTISTTASYGEGGRNNTTDEPFESRLATPFTVAGGLVLVSIVIQIVLYLFAYRTTKLSNNDKEKEVVEKMPETKIIPELPPKGTLKQQLVIIGLVAAVQGFYQGLEVCTGQFIPTFARFSEVCLSEKKAAQIALMLQLGFSGGRLIGIILVLKIAPHFLLAGNFILIVAANTILLVLGGSNVTWLWVGSIAMGAGMSTVFPAVYAYIEKYLFVTDSIAAFVAVSGGLVSCVYPIVVGNSVENSPAILTYVNFLSIAVCLVTFVVLFYITHIKGSKKAAS
ncbi:unnamed protein product [Allacma fusca]|uniref:Sodium-dependent glucose transporter 1 n=1 Tax=Allacma fusca TaxID=39272 RepID=A0A8J2KVV0_9HEXA|nr:unnamed protein product [Allacma fusca]